MPDFDVVPVDYQPEFAADTGSVDLQPVDYDPFAEERQGGGPVPDQPIGAVPAEGQVAKPGATVPAPDVASELHELPERGLSFGMQLLGPLGEAGTQVGEWLRTGQIHPSEVAPAVAGVMLGVAPSGPETEAAPVFYSAVEQAVANAKTNAAPASQWLGMLRNAPGVKPEELDWIGLPQWLSGQSGVIPKQSLADYIRSNKVGVQEVVDAGEPARWRVWDSGGAWPDTYATEREARDAMAEQAREFAGAEWWVREPRYEGEAWRLTNREDDEKNEYFDSEEEAEAAYEEAVSRSEREWLDDMRTEQSRPSSYQGYTLPGGENYRELLLTLPNRDGQPAFVSSHWDEPNVIAHVRFDDRDVNGDKALHIAEIQSDWHQEGRKKGYFTPVPPELTSAAQAIVDEKLLPNARFLPPGTVRNGRIDLDDLAQRDVDHWARQGALTADEKDTLTRWIDARSNEIGTQRVPDAPFKTTWPELALKRMIRYAADHGYDRITWDTGDTNADRYDLSKQIDRLKVTEGNYEESGGRGYQIDAWKNGRHVIDQRRIPEADLDDNIGKEMADRVRAEMEQNKNRPVPKYTAELTGLDLKVGGQGMRGFYDKILPATANKLVKKYGAKVEQTSIPTTAGQTEKAWSVKLTPALRRAAVTQGFPLFKKGGRVRAAGGRVDARAINHNPSEAQKKAGNYAKDKLHLHGMPITIENAKGSIRRGIDKDGKKWQSKLPAHYGYIRRTVGRDDDHLDAYLGPHPKSPRVYVVDQLDTKMKKFDEHKIMLGFANARQARSAYVKAFSDGKGKDRIGAIHEMSVGQFKQWLERGDTTKPFSAQNR